MSYVALYRKFRPSSFDEVRGQDHIVRTLRNQVKTDRTQHAYLFCGTRGTGKTSIAKILAKAVNCENPVNGSPCGHCASCEEIANGTSMNVIEIDAASNNGVDHIREIIEEVQYRPTRGRYKVYIIDEVHMLSGGAFNALLKTLEEPPSYVIFILATTDVGKIPVTILSRCQRYDFRRIDADTIRGRLRELTDKEGVKAEDRALHFVARAADGSMRDALSLLDRCIAFYMDEELTYEKVLKALGEADATIFRELTNALFSGNAADALKLFGSQLADGVEIGQFISDLIWYLRNLLVVSSTSAAEAQEIIDASEEQLLDLRDTASDSSAGALMRAIRILSELQSRMRYATNKRVLTELALLQLACPEGEQTEEALEARIMKLERRLSDLENGGFVPTAAPAAAAAGIPFEEPQEEREMLPPAAPEDLRAICEDWKHLIGGMDDGFVKNRLKHDAVPQFNAKTLENKLFIELNGTEVADSLFINNSECAEELQTYLERKTGRHIEIELHLASGRSADLKTVDIEGMLRQKINMEIDAVDEDEP
ncbi:MAG: DNA polymerase III subunit gamma/tau [Lachnospiraceae bacterium]|nr:DNA polymerase III subunit gamma/tau [Lachnospiraceae bacterium]